MQKLKIKMCNVEYGIELCILFLCAMNFRARFFYFVFAVIFVLMLFQKKLRANQMCVVYFALGILMSIYNVGSGMMAMLRCFSYGIMYIVGYNVLSTRKQFEHITEKNKQIERKAYFLLLAIAFGSFSHFILNYIYNFGQNLGRNTNDIWTGEVMAATGQAALSCIMIGVSVAMILYPRKKYVGLLGVVTILSMLAYNLVLAGRTMLAIVGIVFVIGLLFVFVHVPNTKKRTSVILKVFFVVVACIVLYRLNICGIQDMILKSNLYLRFFGKTQLEFTETGRTVVRINYLKHFFEYPFGGTYMREQFGYFHDLLFDAYDEYGFVSFLLLIGILFNGLREVYHFCVCKKHDVMIRLTFCCTYVSIVLEFCVEPIFAGMQWLFVCYCMINGCIARMNRMSYE